MASSLLDDLLTTFGTGLMVLCLDRLVGPGVALLVPLVVVAVGRAVGAALARRGHDPR